MRNDLKSEQHVYVCLQHCILQKLFTAVHPETSKWKLGKYTRGIPYMVWVPGCIHHHLRMSPQLVRKAPNLTEGELVVDFERVMNYRLQEGSEAV